MKKNTKFNKLSISQIKVVYSGRLPSRNSTYTALVKKGILQQDETTSRLRYFFTDEWLEYHREHLNNNIDVIEWTDVFKTSIAITNTEMLYQILCKAKSHNVFDSFFIGTKRGIYKDLYGITKEESKDITIAAIHPFYKYQLLTYLYQPDHWFKKPSFIDYSTMNSHYVIDLSLIK